ncbi:hypothetical protein MVEN_00682400 [Mycena venus]|uniref:LRAT domain-containing protein n=1 Tax=Mycena venus TaxID=2733690 RepID=A0A8H6YJ81_9AGAR|nr:hypothetical protein MVEN_00682400 [Mycena venus]
MRPVFVYYESPLPGDRRPFHHAYMMLGSEASSELTKSTHVTIFDRIGAKSEPNCEMVKQETREFRKLPHGTYTFEGWTNWTESNIIDAGKQDVQQNPNYDIFGNNCEIFAERLVRRILVWESYDRQSRRMVQQATVGLMFM